MPGNQIRKKKDPSTIKGTAVGIFYSVITMLIGSAVIAMLLNKEQLRETNMDYGVMILLILSAWTGAKLAGGRSSERKLLLCLAAGFGYYTILLIITVLFFNGSFRGLAETGLLILCGSFLAVMPGIKQNKAGKGIKRKMSYR